MLLGCEEGDQGSRSVANKTIDEICIGVDSEVAQTFVHRVKL